MEGIRQDSSWLDPRTGWAMEETALGPSQAVGRGCFQRPTAERKTRRLPRRAECELLARLCQSLWPTQASGGRFGP